MTKEDLDTLKEQTQNLIQIFEKNAPISGDGTFQSQKVKDTILQMAAAVLTKEQTDSLTGWMETHEFFTSPASAKYHANVPGGLAAHSLTVVYQSLVFALPLFENFLQKCLAKRRRKIIDKPPDAEIVVRHDDLFNVKDLSDLDRNLRFLEGAGEVAQRIDDRSYTYHRAGVKLAVQSIHDRTGKFFEIA